MIDAIGRKRLRHGVSAQRRVPVERIERATGRSRRRCSTLVDVAGMVRHELVSRVSTRIVSRIARFSTLRYKWCKMLGVYRAIGVSPTTWKRNINLINRYSFDIRSSGNSVFRSGTKRTNFPLLYVETIRNDNQKIRLLFL